MDAHFKKLILNYLKHVCPFRQFFFSLLAKMSFKFRNLNFKFIFLQNNTMCNTMTVIQCVKTVCLCTLLHQHELHFLITAEFYVF